jgi:hypothetical protein
MKLLLLLFMPLLMGFSPTEYEHAVSMLPSNLFEGGCHNAGHNPDSPEQAVIRRRLTTTYAWSIVTAEAADRMAAFVDSRGVVDFGAGNGYVAYLLAERGMYVLAVDNWAEGKPDKLWHPVQTGSYELLTGEADRALLLSWPPRGLPMALHALRAWDGTHLIYAGEVLRGTADIPFHRELAENWHLVDRIDVPQWRNRSDAIWLFDRRDGAGDGWGWINLELAKCGYPPRTSTNGL